MNIHFFDKTVLLRNVQTRVEKHGNDEKPAIDLSISITGDNGDLLDMINPALVVGLFTVRDVDGGKQPSGELDLSVSALPNIRYPELVGPFKIDREHAGMTLHVAWGANSMQDMVLGDVRLHKARIEQLIEGGSVELRFTLSTTDVNEKTIGRLSLLQGHEITVTLRQPEAKQEPEMTPQDVGLQPLGPEDAPPTATDIFMATTAEEDGETPMPF